MPTTSRAVSTVVALAIILFASTMIAAQSGRRLPKGSPAGATPAPVPELAAQPTPRPKPDFTVKVFSDIPFNNSFAFPLPERMHTWAVERLRKSTRLDVRDGGSVNRRDAIKQAEAETEVYVVLLELVNDPFAPSSARAIRIVLTVYHPVSAKVKFSRTLALGQNSRRLSGSPNILQACNPSVYGNDLLLLEASFEAADSVMNTFNVPLPPLCRGPAL